MIAQIMPSQLLEACVHGDLDVVQGLHSGGASLDAVTTEGFRYSPLHLACLNGHLDLAQWLHSAGASLDATDRAGRAPLHLACARGHLDVAQWLCSAGADATLMTNDGSTPAQLLQHRARDHRVDQQALRSTMACLVRRAQGPLLCTTAP